MAQDKKPPRSKAEIEADIAAARERLATGVADLIDQVHPSRIKDREIAKVKQLAQSELDNAKSQVLNPDGSLRLNRIAAVGGAIAGAVTFVVVLRMLIKKIKGRRDG